MAKNVVGLFDTRQDAEAAVRALRDAGFPGADISFVAGNARGEYGDVDRYGTTTGETGTEAEEGAGIGATGGAVLGGLAGLLVGLGVLTIPGVGPAVVGGGLATTLGATALGAGIGAAAGGLLGALVGAGVPEEDAHVYAESVRRGGALVMVQVANDEDANRVADIMDRYNVVDIDERARTYREGGWDRFDESSEPYMANDSARYSTTGSYTGAGDGDEVPDRGDYERSSKVGTAGGGLAGAATGAAIGAAGGPVGAVVGGVAGAVTGGAVGAAGDAIGAEATDDDSMRASYTDTPRDPATTYGSATDYSTTGTTGMRDTTINQGDESTIPVVEEELRVGKREVEQGGVRINTRVEETPVQEQVTLRDETVHVDRRPVNRELSDADLANFQEGTFEVRERDEEVVVDKQARVVEEVTVRKDVEQRTETVEDTVRRTDVDVEQIGGRERGTSYTETNMTGTTGYSDTARRDDSLMDKAERGLDADLDRDGDVGGTPRR